MNYMIEMQSLSYILIAFVYMYLGSILLDVLAKANGCNELHAVEEDSNLAVGFKRAGFYLAIPLGMYGAFSGSSAGFQRDVITLAIDGAALTLFLLIAGFINDRIILRKVKNYEEIKKNNIAVGLIECGQYVATGLIAMGALSGEGGGILSAVVFFFAGQIALLLVVFLYQLATPYNVIGEIESGNTAAGLMLAGIMVAVSVTLYGAIAGDSQGWVKDFIGFGIYAAKGIILLFVMDVIIDRMFLPHTTFKIEIERDKNNAVASIVTGIRLGLAIIIVGTVL